MSAPIMKYFDYSRHRDGLAKDIFAMFTVLAEAVDSSLPDGAEKSVALRHLLEGKDAAVRAAYDLMEAEDG